MRLPRRAIIGGSVACYRIALNHRVSARAGRRILDATASAMRVPSGTVIRHEALGGRPAERTTVGATERADAILYLHGGGYTVGSPRLYRGCAAYLAKSAQAVVYNLDYRLAPEHPYPAAAEDAITATRWIAENFPGPLAVGGDSAGGNLAAVVAQRVPGIAAQLLIYPATDLVSERPSHRENGEGYFLTIDDMEWFHHNYLPEEADGKDPMASPLYADDLSGLPPAVVATAEFDPLRDDGDAYAEALQEAGVKVIHRRFDGLVHGFFGLGPFSSMSRDAIAQICADLRELLGC
jgi:acetyl esterase/lipase